MIGSVFWKALIGCGIVFMAFLMLASCSTYRKTTAEGDAILKALREAPALKTGFSGLYVADLLTGETLLADNADKNFIPASNVKILTLYSCLATLGDSLAGLKYTETDSTLTIWGSADPTFLHPYFESDTVANFLRARSQEKSLLISYGHVGISPYGEGWMWDDYNDHYQTELTSFPAFANVLTVDKQGPVRTITPAYLASRFREDDNAEYIRRHRDKNIFSWPKAVDTSYLYYQEVPYADAEATNRALLAQWLDADIRVTHESVPTDAHVLYSTPSDTVLRRMMQVSDNMLAEHLLLQSGFSLTDTISTAWTIKKMMEDTLFARSKPRWVDGSGLSRYNSLTPIFITGVLARMYRMVPEKRLFSLFAQGGTNGTLSTVFAGKISEPYLWAKSGSMSGVYNLSGYMLASSGRKLVFSIMNNNFGSPVSGARKATEEILKMVRNRY